MADTSEKSGEIRIDFNKFLDPMFFVMEAAIKTQVDELNIQGAVTNVEENLANAALTEVQNNDDHMSAAVAAMSGLTGDSLERANAAYQTLQTECSCNNQNYNTVVTEGNTMMTSLSQVQPQNLQFMSIVNQNQETTTSYIGSWGG